MRPKWHVQHAYMARFPSAENALILHIFTSMDNYATARFKTQLHVCTLYEWYQRYSNAYYANFRLITNFCQ